MNTYITNLLLAGITICCIHSSALAQEDQSPFRVKSTTEVMKVDGFLNETAWNEATAIPLDYETNPGNNLDSEVKTTLKITYDQENLYFSFFAEDPKTSQIRAIINDRDRLDDNDFVSLYIDPFNDSRRAFFFSINPLGVQQDGIYDEQVSDEDLSWDAIWKTSGRIVENGYVVEAAIPFKSLRFPDTDEIQTWRIFGRRIYPRSLEKTFHSMKIDMDNTCLLCQANSLTGFEGIKPGRNLEITPTFTLSRFDERTEFPEGSLEKGDENSNVGLDVRWGITSGLTLNATLNPDFSNVEADAAQLNVNNRFALQFPEKRPFFLEGADFFNTPLQAFFTRTIVEPTFGTNITGKVDKNAVGLLVAKDRANNLILPGFQSSDSYTSEHEVTNIIGRFRRDIGKNSNIGVLVTDREAGEYYNRVGGVDAFLRPLNPLTIRVQYLRSDTQYDQLTIDDNELAAGRVSGNSYNLQVRYNTRNWNSMILHEHRTPGFRADAGFVPQVNFANTRFFINRRFWQKEGSAITSFGFNAGGFRRTSASGILDTHVHWLSASFNGPLQLNYWINPDIAWQQFEGKRYKMTRLWTGFDIQPMGNLGINGFMNIGPAVDFANNRKANNFQFRLESDIRVGRHIDMTVNHRYLNLHLKGNRIFTANLSQIQAAYNFNVRLFLKMVLQYRHTLRNPELFEDDVNEVDESVFAQVLLSYKLNPQSVVFIGYVDNHEGQENSLEFRNIPLTQINQTLFFKVGYAWRP